MTDRSETCFRNGTTSEKRFASHLRAKGVDFTVEVGTVADIERKVDFTVKGLTVNVKAPTRSGPPGLCVEWRAVNGSVGWLHNIDYVVKFVSDDTYWRIPCNQLKELVVARHGEPPARCPQTGAGRSNGNWYARQNWKGRDRTGEACIVIPLREIQHLAKIVNV